MSNLVSSPKNVVYVNGGQTYNVSAADDVINVNSNLGATEIVLPNIVNQGLDFYPKKFTVNDSGGVAGTNPITISAVGNIVNSGTSFILNRNNVSSEIVIVSKTEYLVNTDNGGSTGVFGSGVAGQLAYFSASTVLGSLTNAQVTVLIDPMVGDSGSGGLKGLVPAPAAGDAAANKYLKADGTWNAISLAGYLKADGTVPLTANWDVGAFEVTAQSLKVDGTAGAGHFHLRYQSAIPTGAANNSKLFSGATGELGWVVDSNAYAFYLDMTGNTASRTLTVPNASGTIALTTDIVNLGNSNLTSTDDARTFTLKSGGTATQNLQIVNSAGTIGYYFDGANNLNFGDTTKFVKPTIYLDSTLTDQMHIRRGSNTFFVLNPLGYALNLVGPSGNRIDLYGDGQVYAKGPSAGYFSDNTAGQRIYRQDIQSGTDCYVVMAKGSDNKSVFYAGYGNYLIDNVAIGDTYTFTEKFRVKGAGSTSATTTALFQNSTNLKAFEVRDDLAVSMYNNGGYVTNRFFNKGAIIGGNNNGSTTSDPNNVLGGSYANGVIIGGYNNTHNGYLGVVSGGSNSVSGAVSFVFSFGSTSTNNYNAILGGASHTASGAYSAVIGGQSNTASGEGAVAVGGNQAIASGYRSFAQGYGSYAQGQYAVTFGSYSTASARSARAVGEFCVASGVSSWASGLGADYGGTTKELKASGVVSFNHSYNDGLVASRAAEGDYSVILGGKNHWTKSGSTSSVILGGEGNTINTNVLRSVILGGSSITATANDTVYGVNFEASTLVTTPQVINTPFTVTVASNAGTITRAYKENKFTNSSAAAMTITISTTGALDGDIVRVRIYDFSAAAQTITWVNTENSSVTVPATSNGSTTLPLTVGFQYNSATSKWRCIGSV